MLHLPHRIESEIRLKNLLSQPSPVLIEEFHPLEGDMAIVGAAGKVGPSLARMARRAVESSGVDRHLFAVARGTCSWHRVNRHRHRYRYRNGSSGGRSRPGGLPWRAGVDIEPDPDLQPDLDPERKSAGDFDGMFMARVLIVHVADGG